MAHDPLSSVFKTMVDEAVAYDEGVRHINTTAFAGNTMHAHGASGIGTTGDGWGGFGVPPCRWWSGSGAYFATDPAFYNTAITWGAGAHWMQNFVIAALGRGRELGFPVDALITWVAPFVIGQFIAPWKPQLNSQYNVPDTKKVPPTGVDGTWFTSWTDAFTGWSAQKQTGIMDGQLEMVYWGLGETYYNKARTALAFVVDQPNGATAWTNCEATMAAKAAESGISTAWVDDPTWSVIA